MAQSAKCSCGEREVGAGAGFESPSGRVFPSRLVAQCGFEARATSLEKCMSRWSSVIPSRFGDESN